MNNQAACPHAYSTSLTGASRSWNAPARRRRDADEAPRGAEDGHVFGLTRLAMIAIMRDIETSAHMLRVGQIAGLMAWHATHDAEYADLVCRAAPFHDIGKICIPDAVLKKQGPLDAQEWQQMRQHAAIGAQLLHNPDNLLHRVAEEIALGHHEKYDGSGYPGGVRGDQIPLSARIVAVADYFDALAMDRCYRQAWPVHQILGSLAQLAGRAFDPTLVDILLAQQKTIATLNAMVNDRWSRLTVTSFALDDLAPLFWDVR